MRPGSFAPSKPRDGIRSCASNRRCRFKRKGKALFGRSAGASSAWAESGKGKAAGVRKASRCRARAGYGFERGYEEPICVVSDLPLSQSKTAWSQLRFWIEDEYKDGKRGWVHWEHSKMSKPERASRLWLVLAIARHLAVLLGGALEAQEQEAQRKKRRDSGKKRRRGRPLVALQRPRGESKVC